ncbi:sirohydrochlorin cobaltochelatase [Dethiosulfatarculus sandiegensis]|uniref:Cobalt chelatase n=1 Tax=Dethiosulfatarculus sandiegensis TaxID=1429043 RepID=A0A0D2JRM3_9BACT|nr:sirohydrochlorin cobaltochelatase [Dethiosulfatarculus sandiegensis]KIX12155.1 cobalt chelatase [Dethiosulfatarculus sandiegensis]
MESTALVLAAFGAGQPQALNGILRVWEMTQKEFPKQKHALAFTSNMLRKIWQKRKNDPEWQKENPLVPPEVMEVKGTLATIANLQDQGYKNILVQPLHIYAGEEFSDLKSYIQGLNSIQTVKPKWQPFEKLVLGRPALGEPGPEHPYQEDIEKAAKALAEDVKTASGQNAALVYMGHGNEYFSPGIYMEMQNALNELYPENQIFIGTVEGSMSLDYVEKRLKHAGVQKVLLKPLMLVAGDHAHEDMSSSEPDSWKSILESRGYEVSCSLIGLGENPAWAAIYMDHIRDAALKAGLEL